MPPSQPRPTPPATPWADPYFTIGVTGTNGKTSTTWMIAAAVRAFGLHTLRISTLGAALDDVPLARGKRFADFLQTLHDAAAQGCRHAVIETTSLALSQGYARSWRFDLGVFTNLSADHFGTHGSWEHYLAAKAQLFMFLGPGRIAVLNAADPHAQLLDRAIPADVQRRWFAAPNRGEPLCEPTLLAEGFEVSPTGTRVRLAPSAVATELGGAIETRMVGEVFGENALAAALAGLSAGLPADAVRRGIAACSVVPGRFEVLDHGADRATVVVDYAHSPDALVHTCGTARRLAGAGRVVVVFGAGGGQTPEKRREMGEVVGAAADVAVITNDNPRDDDPREIADSLVQGVQAGGRARVEVELDRAAAIEGAIAAAGAGDVVVIAGKGHEDGQVVAKRRLPFSDAGVARAWLARTRVPNS